MQERRRGPVRPAGPVRPGPAGPVWWGGLSPCVCVMAACLKESYQKPSRWSTPPSPAVASSGGCAWVSPHTHTHTDVRARPSGLGVLTNCLCWSHDQGTVTACWCPTTPPTRSCSTSGTVCRRESASRGWRSASPPSGTSLPATTTWRWSILTWTG